MKLKSRYLCILQDKTLFVVVCNNSMTDFIMIKIMWFPQCEIFIPWNFFDESVCPKTRLGTAEIDVYQKALQR